MYFLHAPTVCLALLPETMADEAGRVYVHHNDVTLVLHIQRSTTVSTLIKVPFNLFACLIALPYLFLRASLPDLLCSPNIAREKETGVACALSLAHIRSAIVVFVTHQRIRTSVLSG